MATSDQVTDGGTRFSASAVKEVFGHFGTGVTVITGIRDHVPYASPASSVKSVTGRKQYRAAGMVSVNILASDQVDVCANFSRSGTDKFADIAWLSAQNGSPALTGALARIEPDIVDEVVAGDHTIVIAEPTHLWRNRKLRPLLYYRGGFGCPHGCPDTPVPQM